MEKNYVDLVGTVTAVPEFSHESFGERFYRFTLAVKRASGTEDNVPVLISKSMFDTNSLVVGKRINVEGEFRSFNMRDENGKNHLVLHVFVNDIIETEIEYDINLIILDGYLCKPSVYRDTPLGREITDMIVAVNRKCGKSDYIPVIAWGRNAKITNKYRVGDRVQIKGRIQSREYTKDDDIKIAYEVSTSTIKKVENVA